MSRIKQKRLSLPLANEIVQATLRYSPKLYWCSATGQFATRLLHRKALQVPSSKVSPLTDVIEVEFPLQLAVGGDWMMDYRLQKFEANDGYWYTFERVYFQPNCNIWTVINKGIKWVG